MNEYAQAIFDEAGHDLARAVELLNLRTLDRLMFSITPFEKTVAVHGRILLDLVSLDADQALRMASYPGVRRHPLQGREDLRELVRSMK
jgi:hypothetical protein